MIGHRHTWTATVVFALIPAVAGAQPAISERVAVGKATSLSGSVAARQPGRAAFEVLATNAELFTGDTLVMLPGATLQPAGGAVSLQSQADYDGRSPLPILETAVCLDPTKDCDLAFTLDRGRVDLANTRTEGAAVVKVRFWDQTWTITLDVPGTRVALELVGRWPAGSRFRPVDPNKPGTPQKPVASLVLLVLKGSPTVSIGGFTLGLQSPPGPALLEWDSLSGARPEPLKLDKLPDWADPTSNSTPRAKKAAEVVERFRLARARDADAAINTFLGSTDPVDQRVALITLGALDDLDRLALTLAGAKTLEEWDFGITIARHWLGRCPGQDQKLFEALVGARGFDRGSAQIVMQLLFGFSPEDVAQPETFDVLIEYLRHDRAAVRNLAAWHLVRLVPQGKAIPFKPDGTKADAEAAYSAWRKLIPPGQLPPRDEKK